MEGDLFFSGWRTSNQATGERGGHSETCSARTYHQPEWSVWNRQGNSVTFLQGLVTQCQYCLHSSADLLGFIVFPISCCIDLLGGKEMGFFEENWVSLAVCHIFNFFICLWSSYAIENYKLMHVCMHFYIFITCTL